MLGNGYWEFPLQRINQDRLSNRLKLDQTTHMKVQDYSNGMNLLLSLKQPISCQGNNERSTCIVGPALDNWKLGMSD
ncbi:Uncharacterized protein TCM_002169 [Theobroma cacao]|uniref:Uncharacterized protein n=1 Tax=Theobroma cacao TaxID=3641 RepID=A0A061DLM3_THECC|nr:Uncharacterized protein TCM_002169 [Theobroma cacao]